MGSNPSLTEMIAQLEAKVAYHKEQEGLHTTQEAFHAEQKVVHQAEHQKALESLQALKAAGETAGEILVDFKTSASAPAPLPENFRAGDWHWLSRLINAVVESKAPGETFGPTKVTREIQERWGSKLHQRVDRRSVSATLRFWAHAGRLRKVREGRAYYEALYTKDA